ncbi:MULTISPECIES: NAD(P)/FAD-dependent oxidoreductase [unclassified Moorena]|uniref:NAD(P)/FAD-dependent oxidoreductase n=1 Tax=unclassified Moorena TaxID=2683338 RepID=UPI0013BF2845|nr:MULTISPECIES: NAD(P)/FAD-dependent oxidoreductase [unclassified Moorena]NEO09687.1 NAD(P)/FAD-dependent oxidoreductase [Moorena sp. SIO3I8]NEO24232.1 NAD(P)/FAD-dependent oxidoreductase [Moorena sp. SIO4A5]NEQ60001.1 NAD(P)/FAD-dependent oxidoreductase [Moorena sp. SIO4A1]
MVSSMVSSIVSEAKTTTPHHVVIIGGGFGGLYAAQALRKAPVKVTLIDKRNFHLFQPLLYQVATGGLSAGDISSPLRAILSHQKNTQVLMGKVIGLDPNQKTVQLADKEISYDSLIVATGVSHHYFGNDQWAKDAPGLKTIEDALDIRRRIYSAFEAAEKETDPEKRRAWLTFVLVGGGPTGVELAGAMAELAYDTLKDDFRDIDTSEARILLLEGMDRILPPYPPELSVKAQNSLERLGVTVQTKTLVTNIDDDIVTMRRGEQVEEINAKTVLWAAGMKASAMGKALANATGVELDRAGRVIVQPDMSLAGHPDIFVIGDLANFSHQTGKPLPGVAPVAMQQGKYVSTLIQKRLKEETVADFHYQDYGNLAVIGRNAAVVDLGFVKFSGFPAWLAWIFIHIFFLIEFDNKLLVMIQWAWHYLTFKRGVRLITNLEEEPAGNFEERRDYRTPVQV